MADMGQAQCWKPKKLDRGRGLTQTCCSSGVVSNRTSGKSCGETNGRGPKAAWVNSTASRTTHPLSGDGLPLSYNDFQVKPTAQARGRDWKARLTMASSFREGLDKALPVMHKSSGLEYSTLRVFLKFPFPSGDPGPRLMGRSHIRCDRVASMQTRHVSYA